MNAENVKEEFKLHKYFFQIRVLNKSFFLLKWPAHSPLNFKFPNRLNKKCVPMQFIFFLATVNCIEIEHNQS